MFKLMFNMYTPSIGSSIQLYSSVLEVIMHDQPWQSCQ